MDDLREDHGTFARMGLSGAFSEFEEDGFHFSPVIPYGYYAAKSGPAMRDVSISAEIEMEFTPGRPGTQYAGVSCRANSDGVYHAVLRVDGKYFVYRDAVRRPFTPVALGWLEDVPEGRAAYSLQLDCIGDNLTFYVNGEEIESFTDTRYGIRYGRSGLFTKAGGGAWSGAIIFRNLVIKEILPSDN